MARSFRLVAVALPALVLLFSAVRSEIRLRSSQEWEFKVRGYDPRDLLRGRYLNYRIDFSESAPALACEDEASCCLCLTRLPDNLTGTQRMSCTLARDRCEGLLKTDVVSNLTRYYVPESRAKDMERRLQEAIARREDARVILAIDDEGQAQVQRMTVGGRPLE